MFTNIDIVAEIRHGKIDDTSLLTVDDYKHVFQRMYANGYFTNHGPLAKEFESLLENFLQINNVVTIGNESLALLIALAGLNLDGDVLIPAYGGQLPAKICQLLQLTPQFCDVDVSTHQASVQTLAPLVSERTQAVILIETWGRRCDQAVLDWLGGRGLKTIVVAFDSFASQSGDRYVVDAEHVVTVYGFGPGKVLSTLQGGAIAVTDDHLAERFRNIRSSYGVRKKIDVTATCNGRFSEFQGGVGIATFARLQQALDRNQQIAAVYRSLLDDIDGIELLPTAPGGCNGQLFPIMIRPDYVLTRDQLLESLLGDGLDVDRGKPSARPLPVAEQLSEQVLLLPINNAAKAGLAKRLGIHVCSLSSST